MAQQERDNAPTYFITEEEHRPARNVYRPTAAPLFTSRGQREPISFASANAARRAKQAVQAQMREEEEGRAMSIGSSSADEQAPLPSNYGNTGGNNWLAGGRTVSNERRFGLTEAFQMADENQRYRPKTSEGIRRGSEDSGSMLDSRIPRSRTYSPAQRLEQKPLSTLTGAYRVAEMEDLNAQLPFTSSESDTTTSRQGSPSPAAKERKDAKYRAMGLPDYSAEELEKMKHWKERNKDRLLEGQKRRENRRPATEDPNDESAKIRARTAANDARISRLAKSTIPLFANKHNPGQSQRVIETTRELEKKTSEIYADEPEPPLNVHRQWGSKARAPRPNWVQRIVDPDFVEIKDPAPPGSEAMQKIAAEVPLPSIEGSFEPTPPSSRPSSAQPTYGSPEKSRLWDTDVDFTANSIQISTSPQLKVRKLDQLRAQEIQSLTARGVATSRLEEIRERNSEERSVLSETPHANLKKPTPGPSKRQQPEEQEYDMTILDEEGEHIRGTPVTVFSARSYRAKSLGKDGEESGHKREDSLDLLKRLSRATSRSASRSPPGRVDAMEEESTKPREESVPVKEAEKPNETEKTVEIIEDGGIGEAIGKSVERSEQEAPLPPDVGLEVTSEFKRHSRNHSRPRSEVDPEERIAAESRLFDLPDTNSQRNSIRYPSPSPSDVDDDILDETPKPKQKDPLTLPTPKVTGAFIETPAPTVRKERKSRTISPYYEAGENDVRSSSVSGSHKDEIRSDFRAGRPRSSSNPTSQLGYTRSQQRTSRPRPPLINSAKPTSASEDLRRIKLEAQIDDSTLEDFDGILDAAVGQKQDSEKSALLEPILNLDFDERGRPLSTKERERRIEQVMLGRMNQHLKNTSSSIRDARQGIERLEHQVSSSLNMPIAHKNEDNTVYIKIPVPRLWIKDPATTKTGNGSWYQRNWKFTWLGLILFLFLTWYITESVVCEVYCHPINSSKNTWQPTDPFFPWAIPTKLDQWSGGHVGNALYNTWRYFDDMRGPRVGRRAWFRTRTPLGPSDWWLGRDGPVGIKTMVNEGGGFFGDDEII